MTRHVYSTDLLLTHCTTLDLKNVPLQSWSLNMGACRPVQGVHVHPLDSDLFFLQRCAIAVIKINAGNAGIKSHNTEV